MKHDMFKRAIESLIKDSGGSINKIHLEKFMERLNECLIYNTWNYWLGAIIEKSPLDLMIIQEIMYEKRPNAIIECGTARGGLAYYMATLMDLMKINGKVIAIDHNSNQPVVARPKKIFTMVGGKIFPVDIDVYQASTLPKHPKIKYVYSDCLSANVPKLGDKTMVILDSDNSAKYVSLELERFSKMVSIGQYIIVANTILQEGDGGPAGAVKKFLRKHKNFVVDHSREKFELSSNPGGYLLRVS